MQEEKLFRRYRVGKWNFDAICSWLSAMSRRGYFLRGVRGHRFTFARREPAELEYHVEYLSANINETLRYTQLCGWNYVCSDGYLHYFCCAKGKHYYTGAFYKRAYYTQRKGFFTSLALYDAVSAVICAVCALLIFFNLSSPLTAVLLGLVLLLLIYSVISLINNLLIRRGIQKRLSALPEPCIPSGTAFLTLPDPEYDRSFLEACLAYRKNGGMLYDIETLTDARNMIRRLAAASQPGEGYEPFYTYWLIDNGEYIGSANLRLELTPQQRRYGGNIAYEIRPEKRLRGYGTIILSKMLEVAQDKGLSSVILTCEADNVSAVNTIENCGGRLTGVNIVNIGGAARPTRVYTVNLRTSEESGKQSV